MHAHLRKALKPLPALGKPVKLTVGGASVNQCNHLHSATSILSSSHRQHGKLVSTYSARGHTARPVKYHVKYQTDIEYLTYNFAEPLDGGCMTFRVTFCGSSFASFERANWVG